MHRVAIITLTLVLQFTVSCAETASIEQSQVNAASPSPIEEYRMEYVKAGHNYSYVVKVQGDKVEAITYYFTDTQNFHAAVTRIGRGTVQNGQVTWTYETCPSGQTNLTLAGLERLDGYTAWLKDVMHLVSVQEDVNCDLIP